jgi:hypothetical protein
MNAQTKPTPSPQPESNKKPAPDAAKNKEKRRHQEDQLDEALEESLPASDPLPVTPGQK